MGLEAQVCNGMQDLTMLCWFGMHGWDENGERCSAVQCIWAETKCIYGIAGPVLDELGRSGAELGVGWLSVKCHSYMSPPVRRRRS